MIPFYLITGFLGSGKTTLLQHILRTYGANSRIAVIQNEFAPTGVDGKILTKEFSHLKVLEMNNGSVFCVCLFNSFTQSLNQLIDNYNPDMIFLEASGLSDPIAIASLLQAKELRGKVTLGHVYCVADVNTIQKSLMVMNRVKHQLRIADTILLNKCDLPGVDIESVKKEIVEINPFAKIVSTSHCKFSLPLNWQNQKHAGIEPDQLDSFNGQNERANLPLNVCVLRTTESISMNGLCEMVVEIIKDCPRVKGFVNLREGRAVALQTSFSQMNITPIDDYHAPTELIAFGESIDIAKFRSLFKKYKNLI